MPERTSRAVQGPTLMQQICCPTGHEKNKTVSEAPKTGEITVRSTPSGANIYLDNAYRGLTPLTLVDIQEGNHVVILKLNGYQNWQSTVNVMGGTLTDVSGKLVVSSQPTAAPTQLTPIQQPQSSVGMMTLITALEICCLGAIFIANRKNR